MVFMQFYCCLDVISHGWVLDVATFDRFTPNEGHGVTRDEVIACLDVVFWEAGVLTKSDLRRPT